MTDQTITWTALPNGDTGPGGGRRLRLSVFVAPRLRSDDGNTLGPFFPDFLNWPERMRPGNVTFQVQIGDGGPLVNATTVGSPPDSIRWQDLFGPTTLVRSHRFDDYANRPIITVATSQLLDYLRTGYQTVGLASPVALPNHDTIRTTFPEVVQFWTNGVGLTEGVQGEADLSARLASVVESARLEAVRRRLAAGPDPDHAPLAVTDAPIVVGNGFGPTNVRNLIQLMLFHYRPAAAVPVSLPSTASDFEGLVDFHQALSALGDYPGLLRLLGLVFDLELDAGAVPLSTAAAPRRLQIVPTFAPLLAATTNYTPFTAYVLDATSFDAAPRTDPVDATEPESVGRLLNLHNRRQSDGQPQYASIEVDVDGGALKAVNMGTSEASLVRQPNLPIDAKDESGLPVLRSGGLSLVRTGQAAAMHSEFARTHNNNAQLEAHPPELATFFAEDLVRGYRVDVWDSVSKVWHSLHHRHVTHHFVNNPAGPVTLSPTEDEGFVQPSLTEPARPPNTPPDASGEIYIHESLFRWQGWSLSVPRPGKSINRNLLAPQPDNPDTQPVRVVNTAVTGVGLQTDVEPVPGTLPRLRFGTSYRLRVRTVDLAGNGLDLAAADALLDLLARQGLPSPVVPDDPAGEPYRRFEPITAPALVLRAPLTNGESIERMVIRSNRGVSAEEYAQAHPPFQGFNDRHVALPKTSQLEAETMGAFETLQAFFLLPPTLQQTYNVASKERGSLMDTSLIDAHTAQETTLSTVDFVSTDGSHGYAVHREEQLQLPYLPDPMARGVAFRGLPGQPPGTIAQTGLAPDLAFPPFIGAAAISQQPLTLIDIGVDSPWPEERPFRVRLIEGKDVPAWDPGARLLTAQLPKAQVARVKFSSFPSIEDLRRLGVWQWLLDKAPPGETPADAAIREQVAVVGACWLLTPPREVVMVHAVQQPLDDPVIVSLEPLKPLGATFAHLSGQVHIDGDSTAKLDLLAAWSEPRDDPAEPLVHDGSHGADLLAGQAHVFEVPIHLDEPGITPPPAPNPDGLRFDPALKLLTFNTALRQEIHDPRIPPPHEFGDTKYRRVTYTTRATSRFREYFPQGSDLSLNFQAPPVDILSSARPAAPKVLYAIPTFGWDRRSPGPGTRQSTRHGGGVRVYLDRPWYSSGDGEVLGVVLWPDVSTPPPEAVQGYVTRWGRDPVWASGPTVSGPTVASFARRIPSSQDGLELDELPGVKLTVAAHAVDFDAGRQLWFSDLDIDAGTSYTPFVRLALARFQPHSVGDVHLSRLVLADFVQLAPDRIVTVTSPAASANTLRLVLAGTTLQASAGPLGSLPSTVTISVEQRVPALDEVIGWEPPTDTTQINVQPDSQPAPGTLWSGQVSLPAARVAGQFRLVVREFETIAADNPPIPDIPPFSPAKRLVYAETIDV